MEIENETPKLKLIENVLPIDEVQSAYESMVLGGGEINYDQYYALDNTNNLVRLPRLMAFQATFNEFGDYPWYRCTMASVPENKIIYQPWSPTVLKIKNKIENLTGDSWNLAHIIYYQNGQESMGMHSDTVLDLVPGSKIAVFSLGSTRELHLIKKTKSTLSGPQQVQMNLPENSLFLLDEETNQNYVHGIPKKKKGTVQDRIAIVFRNVSTYKTVDGNLYSDGSTLVTRNDLVRQERKRRILKIVVPVAFGSIATLFSCRGANHDVKLITGTFYSIVIGLGVQLIDHIVQRSRQAIENEKLRKLCQMKNFHTWNQQEMKNLLQ